MDSTAVGRPLQLLLTGFEPFGGEVLNPSRAVVRALGARRSNAVELHTLELPVDRFVAIERMTSAIDELNPGAVVMLGEAGGRACVTPERVAINIDDYHMPDNAGHQPRGEKVLDAGPAGYFSTLPVDTMVAVLRDHAVPAAVSNSAGTYLCNRLFYCTMAHLEKRGRRVPAGFIHLPYLHEQVANKPDSTASCAVETLIKAVDTVVRVLADASQDPASTNTQAI